MNAVRLADPFSHAVSGLCAKYKAQSVHCKLDHNGERFFAEVAQDLRKPNTFYVHLKTPHTAYERHWEVTSDKQMAYRAIESATRPGSAEEFTSLRGDFLRQVAEESKTRLPDLRTVLRAIDKGDFATLSAGRHFKSNLADTLP